MSTSLPADATKANSDNVLDDPEQALLTDLAGVVDKFNSLKAALGAAGLLNLGQGLETVAQAGGTPDDLTVKIKSGGGLGKDAAGVFIADPGFPTGLIAPYAGATAPSGWHLCAGTTIGDVGSGANSAAADNNALFVLLWDNFANAELAVSGGRGASAAADWAAGKTIQLPDMRGRTAVGKDNLGGVDAGRVTSASAAGIDGDTLGKSGGAEEHQLTVAEAAAHTHAYGGTNTAPATGGGVRDALSAPSATYSTAATGGDAAHTNMPPSIVLGWIIRK